VGTALGKSIVVGTAPTQVSKLTSSSYYVLADAQNPNTTTSGCEFVWIWYSILPSSSSAFAEAMTDIDGKKHFTTIPRGRVQPEVWRKFRDQNTALFNPHFNDLLANTNEPFIDDFGGSEEGAGKNDGHGGALFCLPVGEVDRIDGNKLRVFFVWSLLTTVLCVMACVRPFTLRLRGGSFTTDPTR